MTQFKNGDRVRVNEGELEGVEGIVVESNEHLTTVRMDLHTGPVVLCIYTETLVSAETPHPALAKMKSLYPDFLKSNNYVYRLTTNVGGLSYVSEVVNTLTLKEALNNPPAGLERLEFMLRKDDPRRGLAWKVLWSES
jgi:hypothetical protein